MVHFRDNSGLLSLLVLALSFLGATVAQELPRPPFTWRTLAPLPQYTLQEHGTVTLPNKRIATIGGLINIGTWGTTTDLVQVYDIDDDSWSQGARLPVALNHPNTASVGGKVYLLGGLRGDSGWPATGNSWVYDPRADIWSTLPSMPSGQARGGAAVAVHGNIIYLAGGIPSLDSPSVRTVSAFDTVAQRWLDLPAAAQNIPEARDHVGGAVVLDKLFVIGGRDSGISNVKSTVYALDLKNPSAGWTTAGSLRTARAGHMTAVVNYRIFVFGGEGNPAPGSNGVFPQVEFYEYPLDVWMTLPDMPTPRHGAAAAESNGTIYIPGGGIIEGVGATSHSSAFIVPGVNPPPIGEPQPTWTPPPPSGCARIWGQCGGQGYTGPTCCDEGTCREMNVWYSQCV